MFSNHGIAMFSFEVTTIECEVYPIISQNFEIFPFEIKKTIFKMLVKK